MSLWTQQTCFVDSIEEYQIYMFGVSNLMQKNIIVVEIFLRALIKGKVELANFVLQENPWIWQSFTPMMTETFVEMGVGVPEVANVTQPNNYDYDC